MKRLKTKNPWTLDRMLTEAKQMDMACLYQLRKETEYERIGAIRLVKEKYETLSGLYMSLLEAK